MMALKIDRNVYTNEPKQNGFHVSFVEREKDYKLLIKRVKRGKIVGGALYYESISKNKSFRDYFRFVLRTIEQNAQQTENLYFWNFGEHVFKYLLQHRE